MEFVQGATDELNRKDEEPRGPPGRSEVCRVGHGATLQLDGEAMFGLPAGGIGGAFVRLNTTQNVLGLQSSISSISSKPAAVTSSMTATGDTRFVVNPGEVCPESRNSMIASRPPDFT